MKLFGPTMALLQLLREISIEDIQREAEVGSAIGVTGTSSPDCDLLVTSLRGFHGESARSGRIFRRLAWPVPGEQLDLVRELDLIIYVAGAGDIIPEGELEVLRDAAKGLTPLIVVRHGTLPVAEVGEKGPSGVFKKTVVLSRLEPDQVAERVVPLIVDLLPEHGLALGRRFTPFRRAAAAKVITDTAWANAQFAAFSNLPALIPVVGNLIAATADFFVLTRNQIMLLLKLAAIYGRDLRVARNIYLEIMPVVGAGLLWRTAARELVALVPGLLGALPKVLIAFAGTYTVGQAAAYYYDQRRRPPADVVQSFYARATETVFKAVPILKANSKPSTSMSDSIEDAGRL